MGRKLMSLWPPEVGTNISHCMSLVTRMRKRRKMVTIISDQRKIACSCS